MMNSDWQPIKILPKPGQNGVFVIRPEVEAEIEKARSAYLVEERARVVRKIARARERLATLERYLGGLDE